MRNELKGSVDAKDENHVQRAWLLLALHHLWQKEHIAVVATLARQISEFTETEHKHKDALSCTRDAKRKAQQN
eukprot:3072477-Amphidinium_carterae.1